MATKISEEIRQALQQSPEKTIYLEDDQTRQVYVVVARERFQQLVDEELRRQLQVGFDQADNGDVEVWNVEEILRRARGPG